MINAVSVIVGPKEGDTPDRAKYSQVLTVWRILCLCFHLLFYSSYNAGTVSFGMSSDLYPSVYMQGIKFFEPEVSNCTCFSHINSSSSIFSFYQLFMMSNDPYC